MRRLAAVLTASAAGLVLAACSGAGSSVTPTVTVTQTVTASPSTVRTSANRASSQSGPTMFALGTTVRIAGATLTVYSFGKDVARSAPSPAGGGQRWDDADVMVCVEEKSTLPWEPWALLDGQDARFEASSDQYDQFPAPAYPFSSELAAPHSCTRGFVVFPVSNGARVREVEYSLDEGRQAVVNEWRV